MRARLALAFLAACAACIVALLVARSRHPAALPVEHADSPHRTAISPRESPTEKQPSPASPAPLVDRTAPEIESIEPGDDASVVAGPLMLQGRVRDDDLASAVAGSARCAIVGRAFACPVEIVPGAQVFRVTLTDRGGNAGDTLLHLEGRTGTAGQAVAPPPPAVAVDAGDETPARDMGPALGATSARVASVPAPDSRVTLPEAADAPTEVVDEDEDKPPPPYPGHRALGRNAQGYEVFERLKDAARVIRIPGTTFTMGSVDGEPSERPPHVVTLRPYFLDEREVTLGQWNAWLEAIGEPAVASAPSRAHPIAGITWFQARDYCHWAGGRLPSEAEWELAARGPEGRQYPWGDQWPPPPMTVNAADAAVLRAHPAYLCCLVTEYDDGFLGAAPVGSFPAGASYFGALDMAGNVEEWCASGWGFDYLHSPGEGVAVSDRIVRGGSFDSVSNTGARDPRIDLRGAGRDMEPVGSMYGWIGCRCAQDAPDPAQPPSEP